MSSFSFVIPALQDGHPLQDVNLLMLDGQPLCTYVLNTLVQTVDSSHIHVLFSDQLVKKSINITEPRPAVNFVPLALDNDSNTTKYLPVTSSQPLHDVFINKHHLYNFSQITDADWIVQVSPLYPLLSPSTIASFLARIHESSATMVHSTYTLHTQSRPSQAVGLSSTKTTTDQNSEPISIVIPAITAWRRKNLLEACECPVPPRSLNNYEYFEIPASEAEGIYTAENYMTVEHRLRGKRLGYHQSLTYFDSSYIGIERNLLTLLNSDGSSLSEAALSNMRGKLSLNSIIQEMGESSSWSYPIMVDGQDQACLIQQIKGDQCRKHFHLTKSEFWLVLQGTFEWILDDTSYTLAAGDFMRLQPGDVHVIRSIGDQPGIRLAMGAFNMEHIYV